LIGQSKQTISTNLGQDTILEPIQGSSADDALVASIEQLERNLKADFLDASGGQLQNPLELINP
jgi:hypothetical protein